MKSLRVLLVSLILMFATSFVQAQTTVNRSDIPVATYFYMPIGDRNSDIRSDLVLGARPIYGGNNTQLFPGWNGVDFNGWYVTTDFNVQKTYDGQWYDDTVPRDYHPGEDWNGNKEGSSDEGQPIYSIAVGVVLHTQTQNTAFGNAVIIVHRLPDGDADPNNDFWCSFVNSKLLVDCPNNQDRPSLL